jgi:hypothetical protein
MTLSLANTFKGKEAATNSHYVDLLQTLSKNQSNKLIKIVSEAQTLFEVSKCQSMLLTANTNKFIEKKQCE